MKVLFKLHERSNFSKFIFYLTFLLFSNDLFSQTPIKQDLPWQHPKIAAYEKKPSNLIGFSHNGDADYFVPLAILDKNSKQLYYINTFGFVFDSIYLGPKLCKQVIDKNIDAFDLYYSFVTTEQVKEVEEIKNLLRLHGKNIEHKIPKSTYYNYQALNNSNSSLEKIQFLDNLEQYIWQKSFEINLTIAEPIDSVFERKKSQWYNFKPAKLFLHKTKAFDYAEYTNSNRFSFITKAILYPTTGTVYLYTNESQILDSFIIKQNKAKELLDEKYDVFALYRNYLEWELENVTSELLVLMQDGKSVPANMNESSKKRREYLKNDYWNLQQKISYALIPDRDLLLLNVLEQSKKYPRKKWLTSGGWRAVQQLLVTSSTEGIHTLTRGNKEYFLTDERNNILATVSDKKIQIDSNNDSIVDYYEADVVTATDYAPFGSQLPGRTYRNNGQQLRYGFNGKENDNDVKGEGNQQDYGFRIYDPRLGRFLSVDPLTKQYPHYTPYSFAGNKPIAFIDRDGLEEGLEISTRRREDAYLSNKITATEYRQQTLASGAGGVLGAAIVVDAFITKGRLSAFLVTTQIWGSLYHNRSGNPEEEKRRNAEFKNTMAGIFIAAGAGTIIGKTFSTFGKVSTNEVRIRARLNSSDAVNTKFAEQGWEAPYKAGVTVAEFKTPAEISGLVRLSGPNNVQGDWYTTAKEIKGLTPAQMKDKFSLTYEPTQMTPVTLEKGATVRVGEAAGSEKLGTKGGGYQVEKLEGKATYGETKEIKAP